MDGLQILQWIGGCLDGIDTSHGLAAGLLIAGLVGGITHCSAMCGPFVVAQAGSIQKLRGAILLPYHLGRITTYVCLAILLSTILNAAFLFLPVRTFVTAPILMLAGLIFLVSAFPALQRLFPWAGAIRMSFLPRRALEFFTKPPADKSEPHTIVHQYMMGVLLGFMPCGLIVSALMAASSAPTPAGAALAMGAFGLGTMPALIIMALGGRALIHKYPRQMTYARSGLMTLSALWLFLLAGLMFI